MDSPKPVQNPGGRRLLLICRAACWEGNKSQSYAPPDSAWKPGNRMPSMGTTTICSTRGGVGACTLILIDAA